MDEQKNEIRNEENTKWEDSDMHASGGDGGIIKNIAIVAAIVLAVIGGFASGCVRCTNCGDDDTRLFICAKGTSSTGIEYTSLVGPAGCLGFGVDSKCWPTECVSVKYASEDGQDVSGCVTYYNEIGCIDKTNVKSEGKYSGDIGCFGISCAGEKYVETVAETTKAKNQATCLGIKCGTESSTDARGYNAEMPRQFTKGCWSNK